MALPLSSCALILPPLLSIPGLVAQIDTGAASRPATRTTGEAYGSKPEWEAAVRKQVEAFMATDSFRLQRPGENRMDYELGGVSLIRHPRLEALLPRWRFYLAHVYSRHLRNQGKGPFERFYITLYFCRVDTETGKAWFTDRGEAIGNEAWRFDPVAFLKQQDLQVRDQDEVARFDELYRVLCRIEGGGGEPVAKGTKQLPEALIVRKLGLGSPVPKDPPRQELVPRVVESKDHWYSVTGSVHSDDWDMPVHMEFCWLRFDRKTGRLLGRSAGKGRTFAGKDWNEDVRKAEVERFCKELAGKG